MMNRTEVFWDRQAKKYDQSEKQFEPVYKDIIAETRKHLDLDDTVLDFGCATGTKTLELAGGTKHIHGLDISAEMINEAMKKKDNANIRNVSFSRGTIFDDVFEEASFDKIIAYGIIHLLEDSDEAIHRIHELLKPGGLFISTTACFKDRMVLKNKLEFTALLFMKRLGMFPLHLNLFKTSDMEQLIKSHNFTIVKAEEIFSGMTISFIVARKH